MFNKLILEKFLKEDETGKTLIVVDVQPEYEDGIYFDLHEFFSWINTKYEDFHQVIFLFNGPDLGFLEKDELVYWYIENGLDEDIAFQAKYYDKGYAFFRYCMDAGLDHDELVKVVRYMYNNDINDSRDIDEEIWDTIVSEVGAEAAKEMLLDNGDMINIPDLMTFLESYNNIILTGGASEECLKEVEVALDAMNKNYVRFSKYIYP